MSLPSSIQTLTAAFSFGILLQAATGALFIYYKGGNGTNLSKDGRRLVLIMFLLFAALWAQISFFNLMVTTARTTCQALLAFTTSFDQLARVSVEQFFLWAMNQGTKSTTSQLILQGILGLRLVAGGILVALTRPDFAPVCVANTSVLPIAIVVLALEVIIIGVLVIRGSRGNGNKALIFSILAFAVWTGMSVPMILGMTDIALIIRTTVPANGLLIVVGTMTIFSGALMTKKEEEKKTPEAQSPFITPSPPATREIFNEDIGEGSPIPGHNYTNSRGLFVVNPSSTPRDSGAGRFQQNFQGDARGFTKLNGEVSVQAMGGEALETKGPGYRGSSGIFPTSFGAAGRAGTMAIMAPQIRPSRTNTTDIVSDSSFSASPITQPKKSLFNWSKTPTKPTVRGRGISAPVANNSEDSSVQPFAKIPTIDLATAAAHERERREGMLARSRLVADRAAPAPPAQLQKETFSQTIQEITRSDGSSLSTSPTNASTTSVSLSPGREEVRRRSPRNSKSFERTADEKPPPRPPVQLQRKGTIGLPSNPRAGGKRVTPPPERKEQTVMLINEIVYDNPAMVKDIMNSSIQRPKTAGNVLDGSSYFTPLQSSNSVIHRPRPIKREDSEKDRHIFPSEHRRSKSGSSVGLRKSLFLSHPGSPTDLPPLPPPPTSAMKLRRLLPNETKSMTFDEKIELLFPAPPGVPAISAMQKRRSSVPSLPRVPSTFISNAPSQVPDAIMSNRDSRRTTLASFGFDRPSSPPQEQQTLDSQTYRFSATTYRTLADDVGKTWIPGISAENIDVRNSVNAEPKGPSAYDERKSVWTEASDENSQDDATTYWGSVHSEIPPFDLSKARHNARSTLIKRSTPAEPRTLPEVSSLEYNDQEKAMTLMLDAEETMEPILSQPTESSQLISGKPGWHRRIGDELPTFSERNSNTRARKMPPPPPLLLNNNGRGATVLVRTAEPSPIDSPQRALQEIQAQLKRFEAPNRGSVESIDGRFRLLENLEKEMGQQEDQWQQMQNNDRDSISVIMTPQASVHSENTLSRQSSQNSTRASRLVTRRERIRSGATVSTNSSDNSRASLWQQRLAEAQEEYLEHAPALLNSKALNFLAVSRTNQQLGSPTPPDSVDSDTDLGSDSDSGNERIGKMIEPTSENKNYLWQSVTLSPKPEADHLWSRSYEIKVLRATSPDPPARDVRPAQRKGGRLLTIQTSKLWAKPRSLPQSRALTGLWGSKPVRPQSIVTRPITQRPQRKSKRITFLPDIVESPVPLPNKRETLGIYQFPWGEKSDSAQYHQPTLNPNLFGAGPVLSANLQARSQELEPDLDDYSASFFDDFDDDEEYDSSDVDVESDDDFDETTLWEIASLLKSDNVPSKNSLLPAALHPQSERNIEDYDEESETEESKAAMAEMPIRPLSTPSRQSLLWAGDREVTFVAMAGLPQPEESVWRTLVLSTSGLIRSKPRFSEALPVIESTKLWSAPVVNAQVPTSASMWQVAGVKNDSVTLLWGAQAEKKDLRKSGLFTVLKDQMVIRSTLATPAALNMTKAPRPNNSALPALSSKGMWSIEKNSERSVDWSSMGIEAYNVNAAMWSPANKAIEVAPTGLFSITNSASVTRTTSMSPAALSMTSKPRSTNVPLSQLASSELWIGVSASDFEHHWISESSIRPESPSVYSTTSSGQTSPASDSSSIKSNSSKASSIWGSIGSSMGWNAKSGKISPDPKPASRLPVRQALKAPEEPVEAFAKDTKIPAPVRALAPLRESRVLSARDIFESKTMKLDSAPVKGRGFKVTRKSVVSVAKPVRKAVSARSAATSAEWDSELEIAIIKSAPRLQRQIVSPAMWNSALNVAILKSAPRVQRQIASPAMWKSALNVAMIKSSPRLQRQLASPAMWKSELNVAIIKSMPRMRRYTGSPDMWIEALEEANANMVAPAMPSRYDASVLHPVFFTESRSSSVMNVHPAAVGHFKGANKPLMWTRSIEEKVFTPAGLLWTKGPSPNMVVSAPLVQAQEKPARKTQGPKSIALPLLESTSFWQAPQVVSVERNWLATSTEVKSSNVNALTWSPSQKSAAVKVEKSMWSKDNVFDRNLATLAPITEVSRKATATGTTELAPLESKTFWQAPQAPVAKRNWLAISATSTRATTVSLTWTPKPKPSPVEVNSFMWSKDAVFDRAAVAPISNNERKATVTRTAELATLESTKFWEAPRATTVKHDWLSTSAKAVSHTWSPKPKSLPVKVNSLMWSKDAAFDRAIISPVSHNERKATSPRPTELATLESTKFWEAPRANAVKRDWLATSSKATTVQAASVEVRPLTWEPTLSASPVQFDSPMWSRNTVFDRSVPTLLTPSTEGVSRKATGASSSVDLPQLKSTRFWQAPEPATLERNWLTASTVAKSGVKTKSLTWAPQVAHSTETKTESTMWSKGNAFDRKSVAQLTHSASEVVRKVSSPKGLAALESNNFWQPTQAVSSERDWLAVSSKASKTITSAKSLTWAPQARSSKKVDQVSMMWSKENTFDRSATPNLMTANERSARKTPSAIELPILESSSLWKSSETSEERINWLTISRKSTTTGRSAESQTWTMVALPAQTKDDVMTMWAKPIGMQSISKPELFSHLRSESIKRVSSASQAALPSLTSNKLFESKVEAVSENHWLHTTCTQLEQYRAVSISQRQPNAVTWNPTTRIASAKTDGLMWHTVSVTDAADSDIFSNPHSAPWERKKRDSVALQSVESTEMWRRSISVPESPRNWLVKVKSNKVEFRY